MGVRLVPEVQRGSGLAGAGAESAVAPDVFGVYEKLGGKLPREKAANTEILNLVGQSGWELVAVTPQPGPEMTYWFKRPVR